ncbi:uncharacterized protein LOC143249145 isoform X2 [Tachypleus tridentatus]|uniref:uncharacterized protein LOC143249145 isoform X2 n=1 Tax=Tachypleus tridentatus TaxID=6853 RepID=UPI003FD4915B
MKNIDNYMYDFVSGIGILKSERRQAKRFYCTFKPQHREEPIFIVSNRGYDGICDCCDEIDMWLKNQHSSHVKISRVRKIKRNMLLTVHEGNMTYGNESILCLSTSNFGSFFELLQVFILW